MVRNSAKDSTAVVWPRLCVLCCTLIEDRLHPQSAVHLGAQLPMVIRGLYEGWRLTDKPLADHSIDEFCTTAMKELPHSFPMDRARL